jgi:hypothetical protein
MNWLALTHHVTWWLTACTSLAADLLVDDRFSAQRDAFCREHCHYFEVTFAVHKRAVMLLAGVCMIL